jgi:hypothetical protein
MPARWIAFSACLAAGIATGAPSALAVSPGGNPDTGPGTRPEVRSGPDLPRPQPPVSPEVQNGGVAEPAPPPDRAPQAVLVQGYVKTATPDRLVLTAPGTTETLTLSVDAGTEVLSTRPNVAVQDLRPGQLVRAALVPQGDDLVAVVVEVMPDPAGAPGNGR